MFHPIRRLYNLLSGAFYTHTIVDKQNFAVTIGTGYTAKDAVKSAEAQHQILLAAAQHLNQTEPEPAPGLPTEAQVVEALSWMQGPADPREVANA